MRTKQEVMQKIVAAEQGCHKVNDATEKVVRALRQGFNTNGFGIFHDRIAVQNSLLLAREQINAALAVLDAIEWPSDKEYDQV